LWADTLANGFTKFVWIGDDQDAIELDGIKGFRIAVG
jgi:hypothetical protein